MRTDSPITVLAGEDLEPNRRILFNGTAWFYADAYEKAEAVTTEARIVSGRYGAAYAINEDGVIDIVAAGSVAAGAKINGKDDGKVDDDGLGIPLGINSSTATIASGDVVPALLIRDQRGMLYSATAASTAVSNTNTETAFDKSFTIPANTLKAGDVLKISAAAVISAANSTDTFTFKLKIGSSVIVATGTIDAAASDAAVIEATLVVRTAGASGTVFGYGISVNGTPAAAASAADIPSGYVLTSTTLDTTAAQAVTVTCTQSVASTGNSATLESLVVMHHTK